MKNILITFWALFLWVNIFGQEENNKTYHFTFGLNLGSETNDVYKLNFKPFVIEGEGKFFYTFNSISVGLGISHAFYRNWKLQNENIHLRFYSPSLEIKYKPWNVKGWFISGGIQYPIDINDDVYNRELPDIGSYNKEDQTRYISPVIGIGYGFKKSTGWREVGLTFKHIRFTNKYLITRNGSGPDYLRVDNIYLNPVTISYRIKIGKFQKG